MRLRAMALICLFSLVGCATNGEDAGSEAQPEGSANESDKNDDASSAPEDAPIDCSTLKSTGRELGDVAPDLVLKDGSGNDVHLHDFCNDTVILIASEH